MIDLTHVKQVAAVLYQEREEFEKAVPELESLFSPLDFQGTFFPFVETDYYESEMGSGLYRGIISFSELAHPGTLAWAKKSAKSLEDLLRENGNRRVNIDIGYMDLFKVVLASYKGRSNKVYLSEEIWADVVLYFEEGDYKTFSWGFPDFKSGIYNPDFKQIRSLYKKQLSHLRKGNAE